jgi:hypothetical protein
MLRQAAPGGVRHASLPNQIDNRSLRKTCAGSPLNRVQARTRIGKDRAVHPAEIAIFTPEIPHQAGALQNTSIVEDKASWTETIVEMMRVDEHKSRVSYDHTSRPARGPSDIVRRVTPNNPGRSPLGPRHPHPAVLRIHNPLTIMVTSPSPRVIAHPVPTRIRPFPMPHCIRPPSYRHLCRVPTAPVLTHLNPGAIRC